MKALVVSQYFWPEDFRINEMVRAMHNKGIQVEVVTGKPNYPQGNLFSGYRLWGCQQESYNGIPVFRLPLLPRGRGGWRLGVNYISFVISGCLFTPWLLRRKKYDVVFVYAPSPILQAIPAILLGWLKSCPVVVSVQDLWPESLSATGHIHNRIVLNMVRIIVRFIYRHSKLLLVQSQAFIAPVRALAFNKPVKYLPNSIDESFLGPTTEPLPVVAGLETGFSILFAGNIGHAQAVEVIVNAAILLKEKTDISFVVMGDGSRRDWMLQQVKLYGLKNLHLPGRFPIEMMSGFMRKASVLLVTLANREVFNHTVPSKLQAYLAAGRPILASLNGEGARIVSLANAGLTTPAGDGEALAAAVMRMYSMPRAQLEVMGTKGHSFYIENFRHEMIVDRLIDHLGSVLEGHERDH